MFPRPDGLNPSVAFVTQRPSRILNEPSIRQLRLAHLATEALRMPAGIHGLNHPPDDETVAFATTGSKQNLEISLTVLPVVVLVENPVLELLEALGAAKKSKLSTASVKICGLHKALLMPQLPSRVDDFLMGLEPVAAAGTQHVVQGHVGGDPATKIKNNQTLYIAVSKTFYGVPRNVTLGVFRDCFVVVVVDAFEGMVPRRQFLF